MYYVLLLHASATRLRTNLPRVHPHGPRIPGGPALMVHHIRANLSMCTWRRAGPPGGGQARCREAAGLRRRPHPLLLGRVAAAGGVIHVGRAPLAGARHPPVLAEGGSARGGVAAHLDRGGLRFAFPRRLPHVAARGLRLRPCGALPSLCPWCRPSTPRRRELPRRHGWPGGARPHLHPAVRRFAGTMAVRTILLSTRISTSFFSHRTLSKYYSRAMWYAR